MTTISCLDFFFSDLILSAWYGGTEGTLTKALPIKCAICVEGTFI